MTACRTPFAAAADPTLNPRPTPAKKNATLTSRVKSTPKEEGGGDKAEDVREAQTSELNSLWPFENERSSPFLCVATNTYKVGRKIRNETAHTHKIIDLRNSRDSHLPIIKSWTTGKGADERGDVVHRNMTNHGRERSPTPCECRNAGRAPSPLESPLPN